MNSTRFWFGFATVLLFAGGCGDGGSTSDVIADLAETTEDLTGRSVYRLTITQDDEVVPLDRDLTGDAKYFSFGSTHIAPAVSFAVTDSVTFPRTITVNLNFGIVVGSDQHPVQTSGARKYAFGANPPAVDVNYRGLQYSSAQPGATGNIIISQWSVETGGAVAGTVAGTLVAEGPSGRTIDVAGDFHFTLPARQ